MSSTAPTAPARPALRRPHLPTVPLQMRPGTRARARLEQVVLAAVIALPLIALVAAAPLAWGWGLSWRDVLIAFVMYAVSGHGITVGFHRYFTHGAFKAKKALRIGLAVAGSLAVEGPVARWVADHRRHHAYSDSEGDPHSPWRYGENFRSLVKGLWHAHVGWLFDMEQTNQQRFIPDILGDRAVMIVSKLFAPLATVSILVPPLVGGLWTMSWHGALTAFFWGSLVRIALLHHVTWSINSICHTWGTKPFKTRDRSVNVWWLAVLSMGESWHNLHHAEPTAARHGVLRGQLDSSGRIIWVFEKLRLASDVRWARPDRLQAKLAATRS